MAWYSIKEAAPIIGLSEHSVYALIASRRLGHRRVGIHKGRGRIRISGQHIEAFLESCEVPIRMEYVLPKAKATTPSVKRARGDNRPCLRPDGSPLKYF